MSKPEYEFYDSTTVEWTKCEGRAEGLYERILARDHESGVVSRILKFEPGTDTSPNGILRHDVWEEVYILEGYIHDLTLNKTFTKGMFACRPPGMPHGPWITDSGCLTFEVRYVGKEGRK
ncbi:cupin [uncultured archaeon]|nr:cupin [uncultured archaeon]